MPAFDEIEHTADWAFRARGRDLKELFCHAAQAMFALQGQAAEAASGKTRDLQVEGFDRETLLVNWLNELLYLQETTGESYTGFEIVEMSDVKLRAKLQIGAQDKNRRLIKAVTFHDLRLQQTPDGWEATVVLDV
jgi:SHS2 domain-containing protein